MPPKAPFSPFSTQTLTRSRLCKTCLRRTLRPTTTTTATAQRKQSFSTSPRPHADINIFYPGKAPPRWSQTPPAMTAPVRLRPPPDHSYVVNEDPAKLDAAYVRVLGEGGDKMLSDEAKWLAVTHKSFDHGRRGYNDRLAFFGRRVLELQTVLAIINGDSSLPRFPDKHNRTPYSHPALDVSLRLDDDVKDNTATKKELANLAQQQYGLLPVLRWKPKLSTSLRESGAELVLAQSLFAILGALSLEHGAEVANNVCRERILEPLGVR